MKSFPHFCSVNSSKMWSSASALPFCLGCQRPEVQLLHFSSVRTFKGLKLCFRNSALYLLQNIWSSAFRTSARAGLRKISFIFRTCSPRTSKYVQVHFRISSLPGLPKMWSSASALLLCLDCQRSEVPLPPFSSATIPQDVKFRFLTSDLHWLPKMWSSTVRSYNAFPYSFILSLERQVR